MLKRTILLILVTLVCRLSFAANIAIIDDGITPSYLASLGSDVTHIECISGEDDYFYEQPPANSNHPSGLRYVYRYHNISTCKNGKANDNAIAYNRRVLNLEYINSTNNTYTNLVTGQHMEDVVHVANSLRSTGTRLVLITPSSVNAGNDTYGNKIYSQPHYLDKEGELKTGYLIQALNWILTNHSRHNIKVVNLSFSVGDGDERPFCNNITFSPVLTLIKERLYKIMDLGIAIVGVTGNGTNNDLSFVDERLEFPGCLSGIITVGSIDLYGVKPFKGHTSVYADFYYHYWVSRNGTRSFGSSITAPRISAYIAALLNTNPNKSLYDVIIALRNSGIYKVDAYMDDNKRYIKSPIYYPNYTLARSEILTDSVFDKIIDLLSRNSDSGKYGWAYGSNQHRNGVQIAVTTDSFSSKSTSNSTSQSSPDSNILQLPPENEKLAQAASAKTYYRFGLQGYDVDTVGELKVYVNDLFYGYVLPTGNNATGAVQYFYIEAAHMNSNQTNFIKVVQSTSGETYGVTNIQLARQSLSLIDTNKTTSRITLTNSANATAYGSNGAGTAYFQLKSRYYYNGQDGMQLTLRAFDIEQNNEVAVYLNNKFYAYLSASGNNKYGNHTINIPHIKLLAGQWNNVDFRKFVRTDHAWIVDRLRAANFLPFMVNMSVGQTLTNMYGYLSTSAFQRRRVQVNFTTTNTKTLNFVFTTRHITSNNLIITFNGRRVYAVNGKIKLEKEWLKSGANALLFTYNGTSLWGVGNFELDEGKVIFIKYKNFLIPIPG